jgi:ABC-type glycerol-3-phosphate transport system substrate-binding protein
MKNTKTFQYVVYGAFIFFTIVGAIMFATFRSKSSSNTSVSISMWGTLPAGDMTSFMNQYFSENDLKYSVQYSQRSADTFDAQLVEALASGTGPDAIILPQDLIVRYSNKLYPIPLTVLPELNFKETYIQEGELLLNGSGVLGLPFLIDPLVMYWNRDIFNNLGITKTPATWPEVLTLVPKIVTKDQAGNITRSAVAMGEYRNINNAKPLISTLFLQAGNQIVSLDKEEGDFDGVLENEGGGTTRNSLTTLALQFYTNFSNPTRAEYSWNRALTNSLDAFANGDLAMYFGFASEYTVIKEKNPNLNFEVAIMPQTKDGTNRANITFGRMQSFGIMRTSANPGGAYAVISALTSAAAVPFWTERFDLPSARRDILAQMQTVAARAVFNQSAIISRGWYDPSGKDTSAIFQEMIESYTTGRETLEGAIGTASDRIDNLLNN